MIKIKKIVIKNFRSIIKIGLNFDSEYNYSIFCGRNNVGKTNILRAINIFFNENIFNISLDKPNHIYEATGSKTSQTSISIDFEDIDTKEIFDIEKVFSQDKVEKKSKKFKNNIDDINNFLKKFNCFFIDSINQNLPQIINILFKDDTLISSFEGTTFRGVKKILKRLILNMQKV